MLYTMHLIVKLDLNPCIIFPIIADTVFVSDKPMTLNCDLGHGNLNFVCDTPSHFGLPFCDVSLNSLYPFLSYG